MRILYELTAYFNLSAYALIFIARNVQLTGTMNQKQRESMDKIDANDSAARRAAAAPSTALL
jgi:hypothetical protein